MKPIISVLIIVLLFVRCEKVIDLDYKGNQSQITIEGNITNQPGPYFIKITRSIALSAEGNYPPVNNAIVTLSDDVGNSDLLVSDGNGRYSTTSLQGVTGRTYTLNVKIENQTYTASSTLPQQIPFDGIEINEVTIGGDIERDLVPKYLDPIEDGNYYRFVLTVNDKLINQHLIQNDEVRNGQENTLKLEINDDDLKFKSGDVVSIKMQCIDRSVASYYTTLVLMADSGPGGGTTPNNPPSNISNGALGLFSAHTSEVKSISIP